MPVVPYSHHMKTRIETIVDYVQRPLQCISPDATVRQAAQQMDREGRGYLVALERGSVAGIVTEKDITTRAVASGHDLDIATVSQIMTEQVITLGPRRTVQNAMTLMRRHHCRHLPIVDDNELLAVLSIRDLVAWLTRDLKDEINFLESYIEGEPAVAEPPPRVMNDR